MLTFLLCLICAVMYTSGVGYTYVKSNKYLRGRCDDCQSPYSCYADHGGAAFLISIAWPIGVPGLVSSYLAERPSKEERRQAQEISEAKHQAELARIRRLEDEELTRQLAVLEKKRARSSIR